MTGRELIIYILQNNLENTEIVRNGVLELRAFGLMTADEAAVKFNVGVHTISVWYLTGMLAGMSDSHGNLYIFKDARDPRCI